MAIPKGLGFLAEWASHSIDIAPRLLQLPFKPQSGLICDRVFEPVSLEQCISGRTQHSILVFPLASCFNTSHTLSPLF